MFLLTVPVSRTIPIWYFRLVWDFSFPMRDFSFYARLFISWTVEPSIVRLSDCRALRGRLHNHTHASVLCACAYRRAPAARSCVCACRPFAPRRASVRLPRTPWETPQPYTRVCALRVCLQVVLLIYIHFVSPQPERCAMDIPLRILHRSQMRPRRGRIRPQAPLYRIIYIRWRGCLAWYRLVVLFITTHRYPMELRAPHRRAPPQWMRVRVAMHSTRWRRLFVLLRSL